MYAVFYYPLTYAINELIIVCRKRSMSIRIGISQQVYLSCDRSKHVTLETFTSGMYLSHLMKQLGQGYVHYRPKWSRSRQTCLNSGDGTPFILHQYNVKFCSSATVFVFIDSYEHELEMALFQMVLIHARLLPLIYRLSDLNALVPLKSGLKGRCHCLAIDKGFAGT